MSILNGYGWSNGLQFCFGGSPKPPPVQAAPVIAPSPVILPSEISSDSTEQTRRKQLDNLRFGLASTIKTPLGQAGGATSDFSPINAQGLKKTLG